MAECEHVCLVAGCEEGDLERAVGDGSRLANQLIEPLSGGSFAALFVGVEAASVAGGPSLIFAPPAEPRASVARRPCCS